MENTDELKNAAIMRNITKLNELRQTIDEDVFIRFMTNHIIITGDCDLLVWMYNKNMDITIIYRTAVCNGNTDILYTVYKLNKDLLVKDEFLLHTAAQYGKHKVAAWLLKYKVGGNVDTVDRNGLTPLHVAAKCNRKSVYKLLIRGGAKLTTVDNDGNIPFELSNRNCKLLIPLGYISRV